jgi:predicted NBD/HSP70 family sugar kinase
VTTVMNLDSKRGQGASTEAVRAFNRRIVLNLIRQRQPISRADLARKSGLQRSTISLIAEELIDDRWIIEGPTGRLPRGRRPTYLRLNEHRSIVAVDIRPLECTIGLADINGRFTAQEAFPTPSDPELGIEEIIRRIRILIENKSESVTIEGIGISLPGRVAGDSSKLIFAPNLGWGAVDVRTPIAAATGLPVDVENAANACVLATVWFDHKTMHCSELVVITVSEGIGTGVLANGQLVRGSNGMAGEFGHVPLEPSGPKCTCGGQGCWEVFASNRAALRYYHEAGGKEELKFARLLRLADEGDACATQAIEKMAHYLGRGMRMIVAGLAPECIVLVGDFTQSWQRFGSIIEAEIHEQTLPGATPAKIVAAHEHGMARLRGTVALVLQKHFNINSGQFAN